ncbi:VOC family protein [Sulfitobacter sp. F26169L]|uniref:VOC family protein n=1 Tax=Sulfitobacter sp. F26169L TaxID=2996015 RepID=UPI002260DEDF|nr:VOC family protein [Sulfitobacter sp. F26169L]MCX7567396.1 VOC family protein [Sulfitobacter sp. F26169L]
MTNREGHPVWYELMTNAPDAAEAFYQSVLGWEFIKTPPAPGADYRIFNTTEGQTVGGMMKAPDGAPFGPTWAVYFGVRDVDAAAQQVENLGGHVHMPPQDIPDVGRFAFVADPQGAMFYLMNGDSDANSASFDQETLGHCSWNELVTTDQSGALDFYKALFGWEKSGAMPMDEGGDYTFVKNAGVDIGAMMALPKDGAHPYWNFAFNVADIDKTHAAVTAGGGKVNHGPIELPDGDDWLIQVTDPQGAKIMLAGKRVQATK